MSFSFRGLFRTGNPEGGVALEPAPFRASAGEASAPPSSFMESQSVAPSPFAPGASLFRTMGGEAIQSQPVNGGSSPFSVSAAPTTAAPLTVGDLLPQIPPELARAGGLDPSQPVAVAPDIIERALREGRAQIPLFELYRVCPALFQAPVSPQDPRGVPLPAAKLPALIAATVQGESGQAAGEVQAPHSPMTPPTLSDQRVAPPMQSPSVASGGTTSSLPPRRSGPPPSLNPDGVRPGGPAFPISPFSAESPEKRSTLEEGSASTQSSAPSSPFSVAAPSEASSSPSLSAPGFGSPTPPAPTPFSASPETAQSSPFSTAAASPAPKAVPELDGLPTMASLFGGRSPSPTPSQPSPAAPQSSPFQSVAVAPSSEPGRSESTMASPFSAFSPPSSPSQSATSPSQPSPAAPQSSPFQSVAAAPSSEPGRSEPAMASPFSAFDPPSPPPQSAPASPPFQGISAQEAPSEAQVASPFSSAPETAQVQHPVGTSPFQAPFGQPQQGESPFSTQASLVPKPAQSEGLPQQETLRMGLSSILEGYSVEELGFDPMMVPSWITVELDQSLLAQRRTPAGTLVSVGELVERVTDSGFRNVLSAARRDFQVKLPVDQDAEAPSEDTPSVASAVGGDDAKAGVPNGFLPQGQGLAPPQNFQPQTTGVEGGSAMPTMPAFPAAPGFTPPVSPSQPTVSPEPARSFRVEPKPHGGGRADGALGNPPNSSFFGAPSGPLPQQAKPFDPFAPPESGLSEKPPFLAGGKIPADQPPPGARKIDGGAPSSGAVLHSAPTANDGFSSADLLGQGAAFLNPSDDESSDDNTMGGGRQSWSDQAPRASAAALGGSSIGRAAPADGRSDQLLLRALLGSNEAELNAESVVDLTARLDGVVACVCVRGEEVVAVSSRPGDAAGLDFKRQASAMAKHVKSLVPLINIDGAETFTLSVQSRTLTFCFPGTIMVGVLHGENVAMGLRDKLTLISRELDRWLA